MFCTTDPPVPPRSAWVGSPAPPPRSCTVPGKCPKPSEGQTWDDASCLTRGLRCSISNTCAGAGGARHPAGLPQVKLCILFLTFRCVLGAQHIVHTCPYAVSPGCSVFAGPVPGGRQHSALACCSPRNVLRPSSGLSFLIPLRGDQGREVTAWLVNAAWLRDQAP